MVVSHAAKAHNKCGKSRVEMREYNVQAQKLEMGWRGNVCGHAGGMLVKVSIAPQRNGM